MSEVRVSDRKGEGPVVDDKSEKRRRAKYAAIGGAIVTAPGVGLIEIGAFLVGGWRGVEVAAGITCLVAGLVVVLFVGAVIITVWAES